MTANLSPKLHALREWVWPVQTHELKCFLPLFYIKFAVSCMYCILSATKETVIMTTKGSGAEVIPVLKGGLVILAAFLAMLIYSKLSNLLSRNKLFYVIITPFLAFFLLYGWVLFPNQALLAPDVSADKILNFIGHNHGHWVAVYRYWVNSLFFVASELWGGIAIGVLFWGFANAVTSMKDAGRFYALYTAGGHIGTIIAGLLGLLITKYCTYTLLPYAYNVAILMTIVFVLGISVIACYWWVNRYVFNSAEDVMVQSQQKTKLSIHASLQYIIKSPYLRLIALLVIGYGLSVNLIEVSWKALVKLYYPQSEDYQQFMGLLQTILGFVSLLVAFFMGGGLIRKYGWYFSAQLTPAVLGLTTVLFFIIYFIFPDYQSAASTVPLLLLIIVGAIHNIACKAMKYSMFDPTKEMAFIPLDDEAKVKGKAAVDLVGARFGKSGSSWIQIALIDLVGTGSILGVVPLLMPCVAIAVAVWAYAVHSLNKRLIKLQQVNSAQESSYENQLVSDLPIIN
jgi:AAA family ATP:ADP antiporter